ncbi:MAG: hypothetical protein ACRDTK_01285 [Mycobacterium sp.]
MTRNPVEPIAPAAMLGASDWDDEDLLTVAEASERLAREISASRWRIRQVQEALDVEYSPAIGALYAAGLAAERRRLEDLIQANERIRSAQADAPR